MLQTKPLYEIPTGNNKEIRPETHIRDLMKQARQYGPIFQLPLPNGKRQLILSSFALIDEVCNDTLFDKIIAPTMQAAHVLAGDGLFTSATDNPNWRKAHTILMPSFSLQAMRNYLPMMEDIATQLVERWQRLNPDEEIDVVNDMTRLTLDTIGLCGFSYRFQSFARENMHPFVQSLARTLGTLRVLGAQSPLEKTLRFRQRWELQEDIDRMFSTVDYLIKERKAAGDEGAKKQDLLNAMLNGVDPQTGEKLDDVNIRYQIMTFLIAGHETTSGLLSFALYFITTHPHVLVHAYEEVDRVLGKDTKILPTYQQVHQLQYISQILKESLRLCPPVCLFSRHAYEDRVLADKYAITKDDILTSFVPLLHRDQGVWGEHAEIFDPDTHFSPEAEQALPANAFKPFGTGQRACIGRQFALQEAALVLGMALQRFIPFSTRTYQLAIKETGAIKPANFFLKMKARTEIDQDTQFSTPGRETDQVEVTQPEEKITQPSLQNTLLVLYGSNMGTAEGLAQRITADGRDRGMKTTVGTLDEYSDRLPKEGAVVIIVSSYNGAPPDNATTFCRWLQNGLPTDALKDVQYTVFGCGNRDWATTYQAIPTLVDKNLEKYGATRIYPRGEGNAAGDFDGAFETWYSSLWKTLTPTGTTDKEAVRATQPGALYEIEILRHPHPYPFVNSFGAIPMTVIANQELCTLIGNATVPEHSIRHIEIALPPDASYRTGDHIGIVASNGPRPVKRVAKHFQFDEQTVIQINKTNERKPGTPVGEPISVYDLLANYLELQNVATRTQIRRMAEYTNDENIKQRLIFLSGTGADNLAAYQTEILDTHATVIDLLEMYPACTLPFNIYLEFLAPLHPRYYSISSSPLIDPGKCSITVGVVKMPGKTREEEFEGVCSNYLSRQQEGDLIYAFLQNINSPFHLPENTQVPIIMIGTGTGLAPFRGFLQERMIQQKNGKQVGASLLFFGCRHPDEDFLYRSELEHFEKSGITRVYPAFSRQHPDKKVYVQDIIYEQREEVWAFIQNGAIVYICGDTRRMVPDVQKTFERIYQETMKRSPQEAEQWMQDQNASNRYIVDIWGT